MLRLIQDNMVHYGPKFFAAQPPPPICPKCGSHRTQVVGRSADTRTIVVRCNACGERSSVSIEVVSSQFDTDQSNA